MKNALIATQESAAVQMLLEAAQPKAVQEEAKGQRLLSDLKEVQCLICSYLHEAFIAEPNLAKLVHFQVRKRESLDAKHDTFNYA